jgi:carbamoyl-phosphate synthase large subunit
MLFGSQCEAVVRKKRILLTGIGGNAAAGTAKSLLRFPDEFTIIGSDADKFNVRFGLNYAERVYLVPNAGNEQYIAALSRAIKKENVDLVIPSPDPEVFEISKHRDEIGAEVFLPDHKTIEIAQDKWSTYKLLRGKVQQPRTFLVKDREELERGLRALGGPAWLRKRRGAGAPRAFVARNYEEAKFWVEYWEGYGQFTASELLTGRNLAWIALYKEGNMVTSGGYERIRYYMEHVAPTGVTGNINVGITIHDEKLNAAAEDAVRALDSKPNGAYTVDLKGSAHPLTTEINAGRFHMSFFTYTVAGLNLPYYYVKLALGESVEYPAKRDALKQGILTIRNTDNEPVFVDQNDLGSNVVMP